MIATTISRPSLLSVRPISWICGVWLCGFGLVPAPLLHAQQPGVPPRTRPDSAAAAPGQGATPRPMLPPKLAAILLPSRSWRLDLAAEGLPSSSLLDGNAQTLGADFDRRAGRLSARLSAPAIIRGRGRTVVLQDLLYERAGLAYAALADGTGAPGAPDGLPGSVHTLQYSATLVRQLDPRWRLAVSTQTALVSDLEGVDLGHVRFTAQALATRQVQPNLQWGAGLGWINVGPRLVPLFRLLWADRTGRQRLDVLLPNRAEYWADVASGVELGGLLRLTGNRFTLGNTDAAPYETLIFTEGTVGPALGIQRGAVRLQLDGGVAFLRTFRQKGEGVEDRALSPAAGPYARASVRLAWR